MASDIRASNGFFDKVKQSVFSHTKLYEAADQTYRVLKNGPLPLLLAEAGRKFKIVEMFEMYKAAEEMKAVCDDPKLSKKQKWMRFTVNSAFLGAQGKKIWLEYNKTPPRDLIYLTVLISAIKTTRVGFQLSHAGKWDDESYYEFLSALVSNSAVIGSDLSKNASDLLNDRMKTVLQYSEHAYYGSQILSSTNRKMGRLWLGKIWEILVNPSDNNSTPSSVINDPTSDQIPKQTENALTKTDEEHIRELIEDLTDLIEDMESMVNPDEKEVKTIIRYIQCIIEKLNMDFIENSLDKKETFDPDLDIYIEEQIQKIIDSFDDLKSSQQEKYKDAIKDFTYIITTHADLIHKAYRDFTAEKNLLRKLVEDLIKLRGDLKDIDLIIAPAQEKIVKMIVKRIQISVDELADKMDKDFLENIKKEHSENDEKMFDPELDRSVKEQTQKIKEELDNLNNSLNLSQQKKLKGIINFAKNICSSNADLLSRMSDCYFSAD